MSAGFAWVFISMLVYGALHSALASLRFKDWVLKRLGHGRYRYYRLFFSLSAGLTLLPVLALAAALPDGQLYAIPSPWMFLTLAVQIAAGLCFLLALTQTGTSDFLGVGVLSGAPRLTSRSAWPPAAFTAGYDTRCTSLGWSSCG